VLAAFCGRLLAGGHRNLTLPWLRAGGEAEDVTTPDEIRGLGPPRHRVVRADTTASTLVDTDRDKGKRLEARSLRRAEGRLSPTRVPEDFPQKRKAL